MFGAEDPMRFWDGVSVAKRSDGTWEPCLRNHRHGDILPERFTPPLPMRKIRVDPEPDDWGASFWRHYSPSRYVFECRPTEIVNGR